MFLEESYKRRILELGGVLQENIQAAKTYLEKRGFTKDSPEWQDFEEIRDVIFPKNPNYVYKFVKFRMEKDPIHGTPPSMEMIRQTAKSLLNNKDILSRLPQPVEKYDSIEKLSDDLYVIQSQQQVNKLHKDFSKKMQSAISQMSEQQRNDYDNLLKQIVNIVNISSYQKKHSQISNPDELLTNTQLYLKSLQGYQQTLSKLESHPDKVKILYAQDGVILAEFLTINYDEAKPLACNTNWCIIRDKGSWDEHIQSGLNNFFVLWNFNYEFQEKESMIGFHVDLSGKIISAHGRGDEDLKNEIESILSRLQIRNLIKPRDLSKIDLGKLNGGQIAMVLRLQPQLHPLFDLRKLSGWDFVVILIEQPQLHTLFDLSQLKGWEIENILLKQPQLHPHFDLSKLDDVQISSVLQKQPQLHPHFDLQKLDGLDISRVLRRQPLLHPHLDLQKLGNRDIAWVLEKQPQLHTLFDLSKLRGVEISGVLQLQPQLHPHFDLRKLDGDDIAWVLLHQPQLHTLFDLRKLSGYEIARVLQRQPQLKDVLKGDLQEIRRIVRKIILENLN